MTIHAPAVAESVRERFEAALRAKDWPLCRDIALGELVSGSDTFWCLTALGVAERGAGNLAAARSIFHAAMTLEPDCKDIRLKAGFHNNYAILNRELGRHFEAAGYYKLAAGYYEECGMVGHQGAALNNFGYLKTRMGEAAEGLPYLKQAESIFETLEDADRLSEVRKSLAEAYGSLVSACEAMTVKAAG